MMSNTVKLNREKKNILTDPYAKAFFIGGLCALCIFLPFWIADKGFFTYAGDFNSQQIPFYMYMNRMVKEGMLNWGRAIDLGSSVVNSYSFYLLGSPFFWLSCLFPYKAIPYIMPLLLILKFAVGNLGAFGYLKRYAKDDNFAVLGALLYTFSGFSIYNIFFNHFIESVVFFPYLLWALDEFVYNKKRGLFPIAVAVNLLNNYFFFIGQVVFLFIYFACKVLSDEYSVKIKEFFHLAFESVLGCFMGIVLFVPSLYSILQNPRVTSANQGFGLWLYGNVQQYFAIFASAFLPPDPPYMPSLFTQGAIKWTSMSAFVALGGMFGFFVFLKHRKKTAFFKIFARCIVCAFVSVFNSAFYAFNSSYYARWFYMPVLILAAMNMQSFAMEKEKIFRGLKTTAVFTALLLPFGLTPVKGDSGLFIGLAEQVAIYWLNILIAFLSLYLAFVTVNGHREKKGYAGRLICRGLSVIMLFSVLHMGLTKMPQWDADKLYKPQNYDTLDSFAFADQTLNYRMDTFNCYDNMSLFTGVPCLQFFNSTVSPSIMEFYPAVGVKRDVSSKPAMSMFALRSLLSVKYEVMPNWEEENFKDAGGGVGYTLMSSSYPYTIYQNDNYISMGFAYDKYVLYEDLESVGASSRANVLLRAVAVDSRTAQRENFPLEKLDDGAIYDYTYSTFTSDVQERRRMSSYYFDYTKDGFECKIYLTDPRLVFFSVPYDEGFTAYVNGEETPVLKVSYGMCAVIAPGGDNDIVFKYRTPYLNVGIALSLGAAAVYAVYIAALKKGYIK